MDKWMKCFKLISGLMVGIILTVIEESKIFLQKLSLIEFVSAIAKLEHFLVVWKSIHVNDFIQHELW